MMGYETETTALSHSERDSPATPATPSQHKPEVTSRDDGSEPLAASESDSKEHHEYPSFWHGIIVMIGLCSSLLCVSLDQTILATAIPRITDEFHSLADVGWYGSSYLFAMTAMQMVWGKLYTFYPAKWMFLVGIAIFEAGSLICALSRTSAILIVGRSVSGMGAGSLSAGAIVIVTNTIPLRKRPIYLGFIGCVHTVTSVAGPLLGGVLTDHASWRWCFYINLPWGAVSFIAILCLLRSNTAPASHLTAKEKVLNMDLIGLFFLIPGVIAFLLALEWGGSQYDWDNRRIIVLFVVSGVLLLIFTGVQVRQKDRATLPPRIITERNMLGVLCYTICNSGALFVFTYYLPVWFQAIKDLSATKSGLMSLPTELGIIAASLAGGFLVTVIGYYTPFLITSSAISSIGAGLLSTLVPSSGLGKSLGYQVVMSVGIGLGFQNAMLVPQVALAPEDTIIAIATLSFAHSFASSISLTIGQTVFHNGLMHNLREMAPSVDAGLVREGATQLRERVSGEMLEPVLRAYSLAVTQTFYVGLALCLLSLLGSASLQWLPVRERMDEEKAGEIGGETGGQGAPGHYRDG